MVAFSTIPSGVKIDVQPFQAHVQEEQLEHFKKSLDLSSIGPPTFENTTNKQYFGVSRDWLVNAKQYWLNDFNWREHETRINSFPNFKTTVDDAEGNSIELQFLAIFSERSDALPIVLLHGWPGSICEFLDILDLIKSKYSPETLPYHVIVPSLPGYAYSSVLPLNTSYTVDLAASAINSLMVGLGFTHYISQGGDLGSFISRILAKTYDECIGVHLNMMGISPGGELPEEGRANLKKATDALNTGFAFLAVQATRPSTIGHVLSSSPLALLSWIGEKYLEWTDDTPPLDKILETVSLYWFTNTIPRAMYHNRSLGNATHSPKGMEKSPDVEMSMKLATLQLPYIEKPCGYSMFPREIIPIPQNWAALSCNLVSFKKHIHGGHFAAMEHPQELLEDVEEYVKTLKANREESGKQKSE